MALSRKKSWSELSPRARALVVVGSIAELVLTAVAMRDLANRSKAQVRGPKWLWRGVSLIQPVGPVAYLLFGRR